MGDRRLQDTARGTALAPPGTNHGYPFTSHLDVYKVVAKVFRQTTLDLTRPRPAGAARSGYEQGCGCPPSG